MLFLRQCCIATSFCAVTISGCSTNQPSVSWLGPSLKQAPTSSQASTLEAFADTRRLSAQPDNSKRVYVSEGPGGVNTVLVYPARKKDPSPVGKITKRLGNPVGMCVDADGNLYVANIDGNDITVYSGSGHKLIRTIAIGVEAPVSVVVDKNETLYVSEYYAKSILEFAKGKESPTRTLPVLGYAWGVALDGDGNVYASYEGSDGSGHVEKFAPKSKIGVDLGISVGQAVDLRIDQGGNLLLGDGSHGVVNVYAPGETNPTRQISITGGNPYMLALDESESRLYVTTTTQLLIFNYKTGTQSGTISTGLSEASGVALNPPAPF